MTHHMIVIWDVLECAKDNKDSTLIDACRRLIRANRIGWVRHAKRADVRLVNEYAPVRWF